MAVCSQFTIDRRTFLCAGVAAAMRTTAQTTRLETLTEWLNAPPRDRALAVGACLDRIRRLDASIQAWVQVAPQEPTGKGTLDGIPFGAKDIIETRGLSTAYGSAIYKGRIGVSDAAIVRDLRQRGAILLGKTESTAFAYRTPARTRNPRDVEHTPGGSSSGSAAAVAAGMVPFAIGTQTKGSVLRPASYCGVTGFKPTYGLLSMDGVLPLARSLDTLGFFTHSAADMRSLWQALGHAGVPAEEFAFGAPDPLPEVEPPMAAAFTKAVSALRRSGVSIKPLDLSALLAKLDTACNTVMFYEGARFHKERYDQFGSRLVDLADLVREGLLIAAKEYDAARQYIETSYATIAELYKATPVILVPAATGPAPRGLSSTGDPRMNSPWTALGTPAISIPLPLTPGLPIGLQLTADRGRDRQLLSAAVRVEDRLKAASG